MHQLLRKISDANVGYSGFIRAVFFAACMTGNKADKTEILIRAALTFCCYTSDYFGEVVKLI